MDYTTTYQLAMFLFRLKVIKSDTLIDMIENTTNENAVFFSAAKIKQEE